MLTYNTSLNSPPPISESARQRALDGLRIKSPYSAYGQNHQDILNSIGDSNAAQYDVEATRANTEHQMKQQEAERQLVLQGLQQMNTAQQNQQNAYNTGLQNMYGFASSLLGGLFK